jgi:hypothetical protein
MNNFLIILNILSLFYQIIKNNIKIFLMQFYLFLFLFLIKIKLFKLYIIN